MRVRQRLLTRPAEHLDVVRGVSQRLRTRHVARVEVLHGAEDGVLGVLFDAGDGHLPHLVAGALDDLEDAVDLVRAALDGDGFGKRDGDVEVAEVAVVVGDLVARLREVLRRGGRVDEPPERIPPRVLLERLAQLALLHALNALELEVADLDARALDDLHRDLHGVRGPLDRLDARRHAHVGEELPLVGRLDAPGRRRDLGLAVGIAVAQLGEVLDLAHAPVVVARHVERTLEAPLARHDVGDRHAVRGLLGPHRDVLELVRVAQRAHVARALLRIVLVARLHRAAGEHVARVLAAVGQLHLDRRHLRGMRRERGHRQADQQSFHSRFPLPSSS